jgi:hypothetical protein
MGAPLDAWVEIGVPVAVLVAAALLDALVPPTLVVASAFVLAPFVASAISTPRRTAVIAAAAVVAVGLSGAWSHDAGSANWWIRLAAAGLFGSVAVLLTSIRVRRERALAHMTVVAQTAQHALVQLLPASLGAVGLAARYVSASEAALVGGDLYEVADTPYGVRVLVGDVRGKGLDAVHLASTVLAAFRRATFLRSRLPELARDLDTAVTVVSGEEDFVTAVIAEFHDDGTAGIVNCGHPPPLLLPSGGPPRPLVPAAPDVPLGLGSSPEEETIVWADGARLLFYTDGLVEARNHEGAFFPLDDHAAGLVDGSLDDALDGLVLDYERFARGPRDDLALVLTEHREDVEHRGVAAIA